MPGPFPGMDPYLEEPASWQGTHNTLMTYIASALNAALPMPYAASVEVRCYMERPAEVIRPDLIVQERPHPILTSGQGGVAVVEASDPAYHVHVYSQETREAFVTIRDINKDYRVVTIIELLSHANKTTRNEGRRLYQEKQRKILASDTHLIEIDLLRLGRHTVAVPESALKPEPKYDYLVCLHRAETGDEFDVWPNRLRERLPRIDVPLDAGVPDVILDLQAVFDQNYDAGAYARRMDYTQAPVPPLEGEDAAWADVLLREKGLRP